jgi:hypothetical protein
MCQYYNIFENFFFCQEFEGLQEVNGGMELEFGSMNDQTLKKIETLVTEIGEKENNSGDNCSTFGNWIVVGSSSEENSLPGYANVKITAKPVVLSVHKAICQTLQETPLTTEIAPGIQKDGPPQARNNAASPFRDKALSPRDNNEPAKVTDPPRDNDLLTRDNEPTVLENDLPVEVFDLPPRDKDQPTRDSHPPVLDNALQAMNKDVPPSLDYTLAVDDTPANNDELLTTEEGPPVLCNDLPERDNNLQTRKDDPPTTDNESLTRDNDQATRVNDSPSKERDLPGRDSLTRDNEYLASVNDLSSRDRNLLTRDKDSPVLDNDLLARDSYLAAREDSMTQQRLAMNSIIARKTLPVMGDNSLLLFDLDQEKVVEGSPTSSHITTRTHQSREMQVGPLPCLNV